MFSFLFFVKNNGIREQLYQNDFCCYCGEISFESVIPQVLDHSYVQSFFSTITRHFDNGIWKTLHLKILPTWINVGVEPAPRHLTYCSMLFFPSNKPSFCYSNNFCRNLFSFLCLKEFTSLINFSNVLQPGHSYSDPPLPFIFHKTLVIVKGTLMQIWKSINIFAFILK